MPGEELAYPSGPGQDLFPQTEDDHKKLLGWCQQAFLAAEAAKDTKTEKWKKYHRIYRSYVERDQAASWRSAVHVPYTFSVIESVTPRMVAQLPVPICVPVGPEDQIPAKLMEQELVRAAEVTDLQVELIKAVKTSLKYGTGILKNFWRQDIRKAYEARPVMRPVDRPVAEALVGDQGQPITDLSGAEQTVTTTEQVMEPVIGPDGQPVMEMVPYEYVAYEGPASKWVDPFQFFVAPEAADIDEARYVIERMYRTVDDITEKINMGVYRLPPGITSIDETFVENDEEGVKIRADVTGDDAGASADSTRRAVELLEFHTDDGRLLTVMNRRAVIRVQENPYWHGEKPYAIFPDYLQEGEFWGIGEVEAIEGLQDLANSLYNQRVDNVRISMDSMFAVNAKALEDERDLVFRPGGVIRIAGDWLPQEAIQRLEFGDVTGSAFAEADQVERLIERVSGVSGYQLGTSDEGMNRTATGVSLITEAGNSKFALKVQLMEKIGMRRTFRQWGAMMQQFIDEARSVRVLGPAGQWLFSTMTPDSIQGQFDYSIDSASSTQTEAVRKEQATMLFQTLAPAIPQAIPKLAQDVLEAFGKKDLTSYLMGSPDLMMMMQMMQAQQSGGVIVPFPAQGQQPGQGPAAEQGPPSGEAQA